MDGWRVTRTGPGRSWAARPAAAGVTAVPRPQLALVHKHRGDGGPRTTGLAPDLACGLALTAPQGPP